MTAAAAEDGWERAFDRTLPAVKVRVPRRLWDVVARTVFDFDVREQAGAIVGRLLGGVLVADTFVPVTDEYVLRGVRGLGFDGRFNLRVAEAVQAAGFALLVHAHPWERPPLPSPPDTATATAFSEFIIRRDPSAHAGFVVVGDASVTGVVTSAAGCAAVNQLVVAGLPHVVFHHDLADVDDEEDRQLLAVGRSGQNAVAAAVVGVVGLSGGGGHVALQLVHGGAGTIVGVDHDVVELSNLRRLVGARLADVGRPKVAVLERLAGEVRPSVRVVPVAEEFPSTGSLHALGAVDVLVGCVDSWDARDALNTFAVGRRIPYVDIGAVVSPATGASGVRMHGQVIVVVPGGPCLRCMGLVTDDRVDASRRQRQGYAPTAEPQVVSLNGTLASEAVTTVLMLLAGDDRIAFRRRYEYPPGIMSVVDEQLDPACPTCGDAVR